QQSGEANYGRQDLLPADEEKLAKVGEMNFARVMLLVGVGHEGHSGVEDRRRGQHSLVVRVQRQPGLQGQDTEADDEGHHIKKHESPAILFPVLRSRIDPTFQSAQPSWQVVTPVENPGHEKAKQDCQNKGRAKDEEWKSPHDESSLSTLEPLGTQQRGQQI